MRADADEAERVVEDGDRLAVRQDEGDAAENRHRAERRDHRVDAAIGDDDAVDEAGQAAPTTSPAAMPAAGEPVDWIAMAVATVVRPTIEPTDDVEPAGDDDHGLAHRQHAEDGDARPMLRMLREEKNTSPRSVPKIDDEDGEREEQADVVDADAVDERQRAACADGTAAAWLPMCVDAVHWISLLATLRSSRLRHGELQDRCFVAVGAVSSPVMRPSAMTRTRSARPISSGISDEISIMADAARRQLVDQPVDLGLGADVDAARRLVEDEQHRLPRQPARKHHLLLVAAGQLRDELVEAGRPDRHLVGQRRRRPQAPCAG